MQSQRFTAVVAAAGPVKLLVPIPFDPNQVWAAKQRHHVAGTVNGMRDRTGSPVQTKDRAAPDPARGRAGAVPGDIWGASGKRSTSLAGYQRLTISSR